MKLTQLFLARGEFRYFKRYVERVMQKEYISQRYDHLTGFKVKKRTEWYYGEHRPWTEAFMFENTDKMGEKKKKPVPVKKIRNWNLFYGDRVEILVGKDKGKQGLINSIIKERNWVFVEGLNCEYTRSQTGDMISYNAKEKPLIANKQVKLVDPEDEQPTEIEWRFKEDGEKVRVSVRTGRVIPLPSGYNITEDFVIPTFYEENDYKDTKQRHVLKVTFKAKLSTFEEDIMESMGIKEEKVNPPTYWY